VSDLVRQIKDGRIILKIYVQPKARAPGLVGTHGDEIKIKLVSPPQDGKANEELISFLSHFFSLPKSNLDILSGHASRHKQVAFRGVNEATLVGKLLEHGVLTLRIG
jgi:uncharacterized protein (TIGR00251 family)